MPDLRDALAVALARTIPYPDHTQYDRERHRSADADAILADPAFRAALTDAVADAVHALHSPVTGPPSAAVHDIELSQYEGVWTDGGYAAAIVARMLGEEP